VNILTQISYWNSQNADAEDDYVNRTKFAGGFPANTSMVCLPDFSNPKLKGEYLKGRHRKNWNAHFIAQP